MRVDLRQAYQLLFDHFGPQKWWPGETPFEVMVGAILTQNTNWGNVEKAIKNLKKENLLNPKAIHSLCQPVLASLIRPAGYFNIKARRLKNFSGALVRDFGGSVKALKKLPQEKAREWLLSINGVGKETSDSILLYALNKPIFVIDAYTKRILVRHAVVSEEADYDDLQEIFMDNLENDVRLFNEYHALIVRTGKEYCRRTPECSKCPLNSWRRN